MALLTEATEVLYGGAAGGGKSYLMRAAAILWCTAIPGLQVYLFRRIRDDLVKNHMEGPKGFRALLAGLQNEGWVDIVEDEIRFWNGSKIYLCHCKDAKDVYKYQGAEIHVLIIDELTHFLETMYRFLRNRVRMVGITPPEEYKGKFPRILCGANPGNIGHLFVKQTFIDHAAPYETKRAEDEEGGMLRQFIPAQLDDNPSMEQDDPGYEKRLQGLGSKALVKAMRFGDWNVVEGAFFDGWNTAEHTLKPFPIPREWLRFRSMDWGFATPFSIGWWAVCPEDHWQEYPDGTGRFIQKGAIVRYREWYGCPDGKQNVGLRLTSEQVADGIKERDKLDTDRGAKIEYGVIDPAAFAHTNGPSVAERMLARGVSFRRGDNTRVSQDKGKLGGWDMVRARLNGENGLPMMLVFDTCSHFIRTLPVLQHDPDRAEDLNTDQEDHAADDCRYACLSRPWIPKAKAEANPKELIYTANEHGRIVANMSVRDRVLMLEKKRKRAHV